MENVLTEEQAEQVINLEISGELELPDGRTVRMTEADFPDCEGCALGGTDACNYFDCADRKPIFVEA